LKKQWISFADNHQVKITSPFFRVHSLAVWVMAEERRRGGEEAFTRQPQACASNSSSGAQSVPTGKIGWNI
jgi:hypothetical protein